MVEESKVQTKASKAEPRMYIERDGQKRKIVRVFYDPRINAVLDEFEVTRLIKDAEKKPVKITTLRRAVTQDLALQNKHRIVPNAGVKEL